MRRKEAGLLALAALLPGLGACSARPPSAPKRIPVRWIMVEKPVGEVVPHGQNGDGRVDPRSMIVTLQPLYPEDVSWEVMVDPHEFTVEILEINPPGPAKPGETVTAKVRVARARPGETYRLTANASRSDVRIVSDRALTVRGGSPAQFRFTCLVPGKGGIAIGVEKVGPGEP